jgi:hypothetical protein
VIETTSASFVHNQWKAASVTVNVQRGDRIVFGVPASGANTTGRMSIRDIKISIVE